MNYSLVCKIRVEEGRGLVRATRSSASHKLMIIKNKSGDLGPISKLSGKVIGKHGQIILILSIRRRQDKLINLVIEIRKVS